jgi:hypothetical protein
VTAQQIEPVTQPGVEGNSRLTAVNGVVLLILLAVEGLTILSVRELITLHVYLGILLLGPVALKCASTAYRFARYYTGAPSYVARGAPHVVLRVLGPIAILSSVAVIGTGIGLIYTGPDHSEPLLTLHKGSFIVWCVAMTLHVLGHALEASRVTWRELRDPRTSATTRRRRWRSLAIVASLLAGVGLATALYPSAHAWTSGQYTRHEEH